MKKLLSTILTFVFVLTMGSVAFANAQTLIDVPIVNIQKEYKLTNDGTISPAETFKFTIERTSVSDAGANVTVTNMPIPAIGSVEYLVGEAGSASAIKNIEVTLPPYTTVGIYTYTVKETAGTSAGVNYFGDNITLVVTVTQGANGLVRTAAVHTDATGATKSDKFANEYSAGDLEVSKTVTGNLGDKTKFFDVIVTLTGASDKIYANTYVVTGGSADGNPDAIAVGTPVIFKLKDDETIKIANLPYGVKYEVVEKDYTVPGEEYDTAEYVFQDKGKKIDSALDKVEITNTKDVNVDTGISLDSIPYLVILGFAILGSSVLFFKKRQNVGF